MAVVVTARELLVTALRSFFEQHGTDFSAKCREIKNGAAMRGGPGEPLPVGNRQ